MTYFLSLMKVALWLNVDGLSVKMYACGKSWDSSQLRVTTLLFVIAGHENVAN